MRPVRAVGLYLLLVIVGGALLAPWIYKVAQVAAQTFPALESVAGKPFHRYVNRCLLGLAILLLLPLLRSTGLYSWRALGLAQRPDSRRHLLYGFVLGFVSLAAVVAIVLAAGTRKLTEDISVSFILTRCFKAALTAGIVAFLEETLFRGILFGALKKTFHWILALSVSSIVYAVLHFLDRAGPFEYVAWNSGLVALGRMGAGLMDMDRIMPSLLNLVVIGVILGMAYERSGGLHFSIGLHAGWIFWLKTYGSLTETASQTHSWLFGTSKLVNGWLTFIILSVLLALLSRMLAPKDPNTGWKEKGLLS